MLFRWKDQSARRTNFIMARQVSGIHKTQVKQLLVWVILMDVLGDGLMVLRMSMLEMELAKEMLRGEDCRSFAMKSSCALQTLTFAHCTQILYRWHFRGGVGGPRDCYFPRLKVKSSILQKKAFFENCFTYLHPWKILVHPGVYHRSG